MPDEIAPPAAAPTPAPSGGAAPVPAPADPAPTPAAPPAPAPAADPKPGETPAADPPAASLLGSVKPAGEKPAEVKPLTLPDGSPYAAELPAFVEAAGKLGLSPEATQALAKANHDALVRFQEASATKAAEAAKARTQEMLTAVKGDPEIGGEKLTASLTAAAAARDRFASPALVKLLNETPLGTHPEILRMLTKIGQAMGEDSFAGKPGGAPPSDEANLRQMYPSMFPA